MLEPIISSDFGQPSAKRHVIDGLIRYRPKIRYLKIRGRDSMHVQNARHLNW